MASGLEPKVIENIGLYGLIRPAEVDDVVLPEGAVTESVNFHFDRKGAATVRPGITALGSTVLAARPAVGLHVAQGGTAVVVFSNGSSSSIYSYNGSAWSLSLDGGTASVSIRFVDFGSYTIAINFIYNTYTSMRFWNAGSSRHWHYTGDPINPQQMWGYVPQYGEVYKNRIYLLDGSRLFFSSVISNTGSITWDPTLDYVDINPGDGETGTGLKRYALQLLVFKPNYIYRFYTSSTDPDPLIKVGTRSNESVVEGKTGLFFHHSTGFYRYTGGYPKEISRPISDVIDAIPYTQFSAIAGWNDNDHIYWSIGNVTVTENGLSETLRNVVVRYTESSEVWTLYSLPFEIRRAVTLPSSSSLSRIAAFDQGSVGKLDNGVTDFGEPIEYRVRTKWVDWGSVALRKLLQQLVAICEKGQGAVIMYQVDDNPAWIEMGQIKELSNLFNNLNVRFHRIRFKIAGITRFETPVFLGLHLTKGINEGVIV